MRRAGAEAERGVLFQQVPTEQAAVPLRFISGISQPLLLGDPKRNGLVSELFFFGGGSPSFVLPQTRDR